MLNKDLQKTISNILGEMVSMKEKMTDIMDKIEKMSVIKEKMDAMEDILLTISMFWFCLLLELYEKYVLDYLIDHFESFQVLLLSS